MHDKKINHICLDSNCQTVGFVQRKCLLAHRMLTHNYHIKQKVKKVKLKVNENEKCKMTLENKNKVIKDNIHSLTKPDNDDVEK
jgi:hypothetical protein